jgi:hypothetical protein
MNAKTKIYFPGQQDNETICLVLREHWIVLFMKVFVWSVFVIMLMALHYFDTYYFPGWLGPELLPIIEMLKICFLMFLVLGLFIIFVLYYLNVYIITDERIVNIEQAGLLHHTVSELHLDQIQDVTAEIHGLPENIFDYGDVYIQTAGETERFLFHNVPGPSKVTKTILDLYEQLPKNEGLHQNQNRPS